MFRFFRLFSNQYFGFWFLGIILFLLQEIPYIVMPFVKLDNNPIMNMVETSVILNILEKLLGSFCIALMILVVNKELPFFDIGVGLQRIAFFCMIFVLLLNFFGWILYFIGFQSIYIILFFLVILPPLYYIFVGLWRKNWCLVFVGVIFLFVHFFHVFNNLTCKV